MKKMLALLLALTLALGMTACGSNSDTGTSGEENAAAVDSMSLEEIMTSILDGVPDLPDYEAVPLTEENFEFFTFLPYADGYEGLEADALIGSIAHSVVLVRVPDDADAAEAAAEIEANANPRKWICVEAEATHVRQYGDTILLVMSSAETANAILQNFDALNNVETPESDLAEAPADSQVTTEPVDEGNLYDPAVPEDGVLDDDVPALAPEQGGDGNMPTLTPEPGDDGNMPALDPGDEAVDMPTNVNPSDPGTVVPGEPESPVTTIPVEPQQPEEKPETPAESQTDLVATMNTILSGISDLPMYQPTELTADNFEFFTFLPYQEGYRGVQADSMIGSIAHSVVLVELPPDADAAQVAADISANANPGKWICVEAESVQTVANGNLVLLVMSTQATADAIVANFNAL